MCLPIGLLLPTAICPIFSIWQVFIRTVNRYTEVGPRGRDRTTSGGGPQVVGGSSRMSAEELVDGVLDGEEEALPEDVNKCGCTNRTVKIAIGATAALTVVFLASGIGAGASGSGVASSILTTLAIVVLISSIVLCNVLCCACCQYPKDVED